MNALDRKFVNAGRSPRGAYFLGVAVAAALVSGCVGDPVASAKVDPSSPIAAEVAKLGRADKDYPRFSEIPAKPADVRPLRAYGQRAAEVESAKAVLDAATAPGTWTLRNTDAFSARARTDAGPALGAPASSGTEAFADSIRKRATPPPPAQP